ncbi:zinc ribbon domain-containing protein [Peribacillus frigoritolerans]|nr:zinc ribbon domain-containing protein [Peribacillus frigoritolerans]
MEELKKDSSKSNKYCSLCYLNGEFTQNITTIEMQKFVQNHLMENMKLFLNLLLVFY